MSESLGTWTYVDAGDMPPQTADWTCSACSLAWLNRAFSIDIGADEWSAVSQIGTTHNINSMYGLMDASGARLRDCLREQGAPAFCCWPSFDQAYALVMHHAVLLGGVGWNHWVAARWAQEETILLANSAPGWMAIFNILTREDYERLGPFAAVVVPLDVQLPPIAEPAQ